MNFDKVGRPSAAEAISRIAIYDSDEPTNEEQGMKKPTNEEQAFVISRRRKVLDNWQMLVDVVPGHEDDWKVKEVKRQSLRVTAGGKGKIVWGNRGN